MANSYTNYKSTSRINLISVPNNGSNYGNKLVWMAHEAKFGHVTLIHSFIHYIFISEHSPYKNLQNIQIL